MLSEERVEVAESLDSGESRRSRRGEEDEDVSSERGDGDGDD